MHSTNHNVHISWSHFCFQVICILILAIYVVEYLETSFYLEEYFPRLKIKYCIVLYCIVLYCIKTIIHISTATKCILQHIPDKPSWYTTVYQMFRIFNFGWLLNKQFYLVEFRKPNRKILNVVSRFNVFCSLNAIFL